VNRLLIHGGAGQLEGRAASAPELASALRQILQATVPVLARDGARGAVIHAVSALEEHPYFNAGTGSKLQADGHARLSASLMDGSSQVFSGVMNVEQIAHPIQAAAHLSNRPHRVVAGEAGTRHLREQGFPEHDPITEFRRQEYQNAVAGMAGTVGAVALDAAGRLCAGTSTGGVGMEQPGRVSDSATVAGNYASRCAAVSCTGVGEEIVQLAVASRVVVRVEAGTSITDAASQTITEGNAFGYRFGLIGLDHEGRWTTSHTAGVDQLFYAVFDGETVQTFWKD
jgi:L-asparaginase